MTDMETQHALLIAIHNDIVLPGETSERQILDSDTLETTASRRYLLQDDTCIIGRSTDTCHICVPPNRLDVSRIHATIKRQGPYYLIEDSSKYGTFINGNRISGPWELRSGDVVGLASSREMLLFEDPRQIVVEPLAEPLTEREREVLQLVAVGKNNQEIAAALYIAVDTVKTRLKSAFSKLGVSNRTEAVHEAVRRRLL